LEENVARVWFGFYSLSTEVAVRKWCHFFQLVFLLFDNAVNKFGQHFCDKKKENKVKTYECELFVRFTFKSVTNWQLDLYIAIRTSSSFFGRHELIYTECTYLLNLEAQLNIPAFFQKLFFKQRICELHIRNYKSQAVFMLKILFLLSFETA
jgi:hypothetical protein